MKECGESNQLSRVILGIDGLFWKKNKNKKNNIIDSLEINFLNF